MNSQVKTVLIGVICAIVTIYLWQVACESNEWTFSPTYVMTEYGARAIDCATSWARAFWEWCGAWWSWASSFLHWLKLRAFYDAAVHLAQGAWALALALGRLAMSWAYFFRGYLMAAREYSDHYMVYVGSAVLLLAAAAVLAHLSPRFAAAVNTAARLELIVPTTIAAAAGYWWFFYSPSSPMATE
jgi:hypothetical protein